MKTLSFKTKAFARKYYKALNCPVAEKLLKFLEADDYKGLYSVEVAPQDFNNPDDYRRAAAAVGLLKKYEDLTVDGIDPAAAAVENWYVAERQCFETNRRLSSLLEPYPVQPDERAVAFFKQVRRYSRMILGPAPGLIDPVFGPGATMSDPRRRSTVPDKCQSVVTLTPETWPLLSAWSQTAWARVYDSSWDLQVVSHNTFFSVPKNYKTERGCAKEPSLNAAYQRGVGVTMMNRLHRAGFVPSRAKEIHMTQAKIASVSGLFATLDLKMASDTVSFMLVKHGLPPDWFELLNSLRAPSTLVPTKAGASRRVWLEKFSSMGNGFTFELEMTLFTSVILAVCPHLVIGQTLFVWGDDLIIPTDDVEIVKKALAFCGLMINEEKSFTSGPFRESCGGDYWDGFDVRPFHLKQDIDNGPEEIIKVANGIRKMGLRDPNPFGLSHDLRHVWFWLLDGLSTDVRRCRGPEELGDIVIHDEERRWSVRWRGQIRYVRVYRPKVDQRTLVSFGRYCPRTQMAAALYGICFYETLPTLGQKPKWWNKTGDDYRRLVTRNTRYHYKCGWSAYS